MPPSSTLKAEAAGASELLVTIYESVRCYKQENHNINFYSSEKLLQSISLKKLDILYFEDVHSYFGRLYSSVIRATYVYMAT